MVHRSYIIAVIDLLDGESSKRYPVMVFERWSNIDSMNKLFLSNNKPTKTLHIAQQLKLLLLLLSLKLIFEECMHLTHGIKCNSHISHMNSFIFSITIDAYVEFCCVFDILLLISDYSQLLSAFRSSVNCGLNEFVTP